MLIVAAGVAGLPAASLLAVRLRETRRHRAGRANQSSAWVIFPSAWLME